MHMVDHDFWCWVFFVTLSFAVGWRVRTGDMQGAFGASAFFASFLGVVGLGVTAIANFLR